jgi:SAM-dependent methyltransferase
MTTRHLDLGCGSSPRNPYLQAELHGCDIREITGEIESLGFIYKKADLINGQIPYSDNYFNSVSAYDFLEHIPRQIVSRDGGVKNSFVDLMSEIHRILKPGGVFIAVTPCVPHHAAFSDPTHVNFITKQTCEYFTGEKPAASIYGFSGSFEVLKNCKDIPSNYFHLNTPVWRKELRKMHRRIFGEGLSHVVWELKACKTV